MGRREREKRERKQREREDKKKKESCRGLGAGMFERGTFN